MSKVAVYDHLRDPEVLNRIHELVLNGMTWKGITEKLEVEFDLKTSYQPVQKAYQSMSARRDLTLKNDDDLMGEYKHQLKKLFKFLNSQTEDLQTIWDSIKKSGLQEVKLKEVLMVSKEIRERMKMIQDRIDKVDGNDGKINNQTLNVYQGSQGVFKHVKDYLELLDKGDFITKNKSYPWEEEGDSIEIIEMEQEE